MSSEEYTIGLLTQEQRVTMAKLALAGCTFKLVHPHVNMGWVTHWPDGGVSDYRSLIDSIHRAARVMKRRVGADAIW